MLVSMIRAKLHHARVTDANIEYVGSITIDTDLLDQARLLPYEQVLVVDVDNGARFETYTIPGERGSRVIQVNGAAAHLVSLGDRLIVMSFGLVEYPPPAEWQPQVAVLDAENNVIAIAKEARYGNA